MILSFVGIVINFIGAMTNPARQDRVVGFLGLFIIFGSIYGIQKLRSKRS